MSLMIARLVPSRDRIVSRIVQIDLQWSIWVCLMHQRTNLRQPTATRFSFELKRRLLFILTPVMRDRLQF